MTKKVCTEHLHAPSDPRSSPQRPARNAPKVIPGSASTCLSTMGSERLIISCVQAGDIQHAKQGDREGPVRHRGPVRCRSFHVLAVCHFECPLELTRGHGNRGMCVVAAGSDDVSKEMQRILTQEQGALRGVSANRIIIIHIENPTVPFLDLVDMPGLVEVPSDNEPNNMHAQTTSLIKSHLQSEHGSNSMYLAIIKATSPPNASIALRILHEANVYAKTFGVFTFCDELGIKNARRLKDWVRDPTKGMSLSSLLASSLQFPFPLSTLMSRGASYTHADTKEAAQHKEGSSWIPTAGLRQRMRRQRMIAATP